MSSELKDPQFHSRLKELIGSESPFAWASRMGISKGAFHRIWNEGTIPGPEHLKRIKEKTGCSIDWLLTGEAQKRRGEKLELVLQDHVAQYADLEGIAKDYVLVPRYDVKASAGGGTLVHSEQVVDHLVFKTEWVNRALGVSPKALALISVRGDSMEPTLSDGDLVLIDTSINNVENNAIYVLQNNGTLLVKRIQLKMAGSLLVISDNPVYRSETLFGEGIDQLKVIGRVVWSGRRM